MTMYGRGTPAATHAAARARARSRRLKSVVAIVGSCALVLGIGAAGWVMTRPDSASGRPLSQTASPTADPTVDPSQTTPPTASPSARAKPSPTKKPTPKPTPTKKPPAAERPPAPTPIPSPSPGCTPTYSGPKAPIADVKQALETAAQRQYWVGVVPPADLNGPLPVITVPINLMKAIAWQESGWQSTIIACDGGIGTMQIMPGTRDKVNLRFGENFNVNTLDGNTAIGAAYIEWLIMYFGLYYFGAFDLSATAPVGDGGATMRLLDVVVSAYNVGPGNVEDLKGTEDGSDDTLSIPNQSYVNNVKALMTNCVCLTY